MTAPTIPPPPPPAVPQRPVWAGVISALAAATLLFGVVGVVVRSVDQGRGHPDEWDPRVAPLAEFVEEARGLDFDHPVHVDFLTASEYSEATTTADEDLEDDERVDLDRYAGLLRAVGLASGEVDLLTAYNQSADAGTLAFYEPDTKRVRVRGTELTVGLQVTLVHELTHALQDQHFDLDRLYDDDIDDGAASAFRALVEGDATRVEEAFIDEVLTESQQAEYDAEYADELADSEASTTEVPVFVSASFAIPYALGAPFVLMLVNDDGNDAVDAAFDDPPDTEDDLFDPASHHAGEEDAELELELDDDVETFDEGPFGSPSWYLMLAERIDPKTAFEAALGWGGDSFAAFERDDRVCIQAGFVGDTAADEREMTAALETWVDALPGGQADVVQVDGHPGFLACDPGADVDMELTERSEEALSIPSIWGYLVADAIAFLDADGARCYARAVLDELTYEELVDPEGSAFADEAFQRLLSEAFESCV